jgi:hypothetical protein
MLEAENRARVEYLTGAEKARKTRNSRDRTGDEPDNHGFHGWHGWERGIGRKITVSGSVTRLPGSIIMGSVKLLGES